MPTRTDLGTAREDEFQQRLLAAVREVMRHTRLGVTQILNDIRDAGALQAAKRRLHPRDRELPQFLQRPSKYFRATKRIGRLDLSVEAIAINPRWQDLFTQEETDEAAATLAEHGFNRTLEATTGTVALSPIIEQEPSLSPIVLRERQGALDLDDISILAGDTECEVTARVASELRSGRRPWPPRFLRRHLDECRTCRNQYPELVSAFQRFDEEALVAWLALLTAFQATMELGDEQLKGFHVLQPEDYEEPEHYEIDLDVQLSDCIRPLCAWRAVRVGCQLGRFMNAFAATFDEQVDLWLNWRGGKQQGPIPSSVRGLDQRLFILCLLARNLLLVRSWPSEDEGALWVPTNGDLVPCPNLLRLELTWDMEEWEELLGEPPRDLNLLGLLNLAHLAAGAQLQGLQSEPHPLSVHESDHTEEMLHDIQRAQAEAQQREDAMIDVLARIASHVESTDPFACEDSLLDQLSNIWAKLTPRVRSQLLMSEQMHRMRCLAAPGKILDTLATAFELQLQHSVMAVLFDSLKYRKVKSLVAPQEWKDVERREKPLWKPEEKADKCTLGTMRLILRHPQVEIEEFFTQYGLDRVAIAEATEAVYQHRNQAVHGHAFDIGTVGQIRKDWFSWKNRVGGIYSVFFRSNEFQDS